MTQESSNTNISKKAAALYFLVSLAIIILLLIFVPSFFWVPLPFVLTYAVVALDKI